MLAYDALLALRKEYRRSAWDERDAILYALGIGMCSGGLDSRELHFVYERELNVMPSFVTVLAMGMMPTATDFDCDPVQLLHVGQQLTLHCRIPVTGTALGTSRITGAVDKKEKGALIFVETVLFDEAQGAPLATLTATMLALDGGGIGGPSQDTASVAPHLPDRAPDLTLPMATRSDQALLYRLSGDCNPLHVDPAEARRVGFERPILHGLCTYGISCRAVLTGFADYRAERLIEHRMRFSAPVYPGETITMDLWREGDTVAFVGHIEERRVTVIRDGVSRLAPLTASAL